jgi:hypothetical protein
VSTYFTTSKKICFFVKGINVVELWIVQTLNFTYNFIYVTQWKAKKKRHNCCCLWLPVFHEDVWDVQIYFHAFLIAALDGGKWSVSRHVHFNTAEEAMVFMDWDWVDPSNKVWTLCGGGKSLAPAENWITIPLPSSPYSSQYNDWAIVVAIKEA